MTAIIDGKLIHTDITKNSNGGTELMARRVHGGVEVPLLTEFNIVFSRQEGVELTPGKKNILYCHDLAQDPQVRHLSNDGWKKWDKIVFVSHWQRQQYQDYLGVPPSASAVMRNCITPIEEHEKPDDKLRLIYFSTPHRGLNIAFAAFEELMKQKQTLDIEFNVFSSFDLYGWGQRDVEFKPLFDKLEKHPNVNYNKAVSNEQIREELKRSHIFMHPSIWPETSCLCLIEAMSAGCMCIHSSLAALPETSLGLTHMYDFTENMEEHAKRFYLRLAALVNIFEEGPKHSIQDYLGTQKVVADYVYDTSRRIDEWNNLLRGIIAQ